MHNRTNSGRLRSTFILFIALAGSTLSFAGGPPSFSFEAPTGSAKPGASSPVLVVHAFSCHEPTDAALSAHAEGVVGGKRRTIPLKLESAGKTGVYTVARQWPADGSWALVFSLDRGGRTTALVTLDSKGNPVLSPSSGSQLADSSIRTISGQAQERDIDAVLTAKAVK
jgi:hypothetical protein